MEDLIKSWEKLADKYYAQAQESDHFGAERLFASSEILRFCADQLRRKIKED